MLIKQIVVASCQMPYVKSNMEEAIELVFNYAFEAQKKGASLVCFPECFLQGYELNSTTQSCSLDLSSSAFHAILQKVRNLNIFIVLGLIEQEQENLFNTAIVVKCGQLIGKYRKNKLIGIEKEIFKPGVGFPVFEVGKIRFGINICNDLNFQECTDAVSNQKADLLVCPSNNMLSYSIAQKWKHKHNLSRTARASAAGLWLVSSDVTGEVDGRIGFGPTAVISPEGHVVKQLPLMKPGLLMYKICI